MKKIKLSFTHWVTFIIGIFIIANTITFVTLHTAGSGIVEALQDHYIRERKRKTKVAIEVLHGSITIVHKNYMKLKIQMDFNIFLKDVLKNVTFTPENKIRHHFWVVDMDHNMFFHPIKFNLNGKNLYGVKDSKNHYYVREIINTANGDTGEGYIYHYDDKKLIVNYCKLFEPLGLIIVTSSSLEDLKLKLSEDRMIAYDRVYTLMAIFIFLSILGAMVIIAVVYVATKPNKDTT